MNIEYMHLSSYWRILIIVNLICVTICMIMDSSLNMGLKPQGKLALVNHLVAVFEVSKGLVSGV